MTGQTGAFATAPHHTLHTDGDTQTLPLKTKTKTTGRSSARLSEPSPASPSRPPASRTPSLWKRLKPSECFICRPQLKMLNIECGVGNKIGKGKVSKLNSHQPLTPQPAFAGRLRERRRFARRRRRPRRRAGARRRSPCPTTD
jgi:hypothetical protein